MSLNRIRRPSTFAAIGAITFMLTGCAATGDLLGDFAGRVYPLGYETCEQRDVPPREDTVEAMFMCSADEEHGVMLLVFSSTSARGTWTDEFGPVYHDSGTDVIGHDRWVILGNDSEDVEELAKGLGAPLASN